MGKYVNIMAKVSPECGDRLDRIVKQYGFRSKYEVLQTALSLFMQYADPGGEMLTPDGEVTVQALRELFGSVVEARHHLAHVKPNGNKRVEPSEIVGFYGRECLLIRTLDKQGNTSTTSNRRDVLEVVLSKTLPDATLARLREIRRVGKFPTLLSALMSVVGQAIVEDVEVGELFGELGDTDPRSVKLGVENKPARAKNKRVFE